MPFIGSFRSAFGPQSQSGAGVLYLFTTATFTTGGATGRNGPNITQARSGVGNPSWASAYLNMTVNGIQEWTVPEDGLYQITCLGARGGQAATNSGGWGFGARAIGTFSLTKGEVLSIVVGQSGVSTPPLSGIRTSAGGGGASAVWKKASDSEPLIVAGGGAGSTDQPEGNAGVGGTRHARVHAVIETSGQGATNDSGGIQLAGGSGGSGGNTSGFPSAGAGGGFKSDGSSLNAGDRSGKQLRTDARGGDGGSDSNRISSGQAGGANSAGGFGGGGGAEGWYGCSGAGGGYSGGSATADAPRTAGGGGGSYNAGTNQTMTAAFNNGVGSVTITKL